MRELSSLKVPSLDEAKDDLVPPKDHGPSVWWSEEILVGLDWRKLVELARAMAASRGHEPGGTRILPDGMAEFSIPQGAARMVVRLAPWNRWMASGGCIEKFAAALAGQGDARGVYLAPGGISPSAEVAATLRGIEVVEAEAMAEALNELPAEHRKYFHDTTMQGQPFVPSCPVCLRPLVQKKEVIVDEPPTRRLRDLRYQTSDIVAEPVVVRRLEILGDCEVHFLREVRAKDVFVQGVVFGDIVCEGSVLLNPGGVLHGNVAARSVLVRPGAALLGETRILQGNLGSMEEKSPVAWTWRCENAPALERCAHVMFMPH